MNENFVSLKVLPAIGAKPERAFSLTKLGLDELKLQTGFEVEKIQIKSNYPMHDLQLSSIRNQFSKMHECEVFLSETVIQSELLEKDVPDLTLFRAHRVDAVVFIRIGSNRVWTSIEMERGHKGNDRYRERFKKIYQTDSMKAILFVPETIELKNTLIDIERTVYPANKRRLLFCDLPSLTSAKFKVTFSTSDGNNLDFNLSSGMNETYPSLDQGFINSLPQQG